MNTTNRAIQDQIEGNHCFGCGADNPRGLRIKSYWQDNGTATCWFEPRHYHCASPEPVLNGGIIATIVDCHCICTAMAHAYLRDNRDIGSHPQITFVTASLHVDYKAPTPIAGPVGLVARVVESTETKSVVRCQLQGDNTICAKAEVIAVRVPDNWY